MKKKVRIDFEIDVVPHEHEISFFVYYRPLVYCTFTKMQRN